MTSNSYEAPSRQEGFFTPSRGSAIFRMQASAGADRKGWSEAAIGARRA
jgi:hypothetical protein